jgi:hypothetical protein
MIKFSKFYIGFLFILLFAFFCSCVKSKKADEYKVDGLPAENENKDGLNTENENKEAYIRQILSFVRNHVSEGYYIFGDSIVSVSKEENAVIIRGFDIKNDELLYDDIVTFNILYDNILYEELSKSGDRIQKKISTIYNDQIYNEIHLYTEGRRWIDGWGSFYNGDNSLEIGFGGILSGGPNLRLNSSINGIFIYKSHEIDEKILKYTYDYQKQYTGQYVYDSYILFGMDTDEFNNSYIEEKNNSYIISINDNGFLFIDDGYGNPYYERFSGTKIIDENVKIDFFGNAPSYGPSVLLYFYKGDIIWEKDMDNDDKKYQIIFKRK